MDKIDIDEGFGDKIEVKVSDESFLTDNAYSAILTFTFDDFKDAYEKAMKFAEFCLKQGMYVQMKEISEKII